MPKLSIEDVVIHGVNDPAEKVWIDEGDTDDQAIAGVLGGELDDEKRVLTMTFEPFKDANGAEPTVVRFVELEALAELLGTVAIASASAWRAILIERLNITE